MNNRSINQWDTFCGGHDLETDSSPFVAEISPYAELFSSLHTLSWDTLAKQYGHAFKLGRILPETLYGVLELRAISQISKQFSLLPLESLSQPRYSDVLHHFLGGAHLPGTVLDRFQMLSSQAENRDQNYIIELVFNLRGCDPRVGNLLLDCHEQGVLFLSHFDDLSQDRLRYHCEFPETHLFLPSVTLRQLMVKMIYDVAGFTELVGRVGALTIDDIEAGVIKNQRYATFSYPGVPDPQDFHGVKAPVFFITLHDELHRRAMSAIPPRQLETYLSIVNLVRTATGIRWSKEIWNAIDLEIHIRAFTIDNSSLRYKDYFHTKILEAMLTLPRFSDQSPRGVFMASYKDKASLETTLIIMIDILENEMVWQRKGVYISGFSNRIQDLFYKAHFYLGKLDAALPIASKVAIIMHCMDYGLKGDISVVIQKYHAQTEFKKIDGYIQLTLNGRPVSCVTKQQSFIEGQVSNLLYSIESELNIRRESPLFVGLVAVISELINGILDLMHWLDRSKAVDQRVHTILLWVMNLIQDPCNKEARSSLASLIDQGGHLNDELIKLEDALKSFEGYDAIHYDEDHACLISLKSTSGLTLPSALTLFAKSNQLNCYDKKAAMSDQARALYL